jgi:hypothetical protein
MTTKKSIVMQRMNGLLGGGERKADSALGAVCGI